jgi:hypothetical protein
MWDFSVAPSPWSKRCRVTAGERDQQARSADTARCEAAALTAGTPLPAKPRRRSRKDGGRAVIITPAEAETLWAFLGTHGAEIVSLLALARSEADELELARAYRAILDGKSDAHLAWLRVVRRLSEPRE